MSKLKPVIALLCALCLLAAAFPAAAADDLTLEEERKIGEEAFKEITATVSLVEDPDCVAFITDLGDRLAKEFPDCPFTFRFYIADVSEFNALALPGGWMIFFRGLITTLKSEGELAGIMGHEMSHVYYRHINERIKKSGPVTVATVAGMLAGILLATLGGSPELGQAVSLGSMAGGAQQQLAFSREDEKQADYGGYKAMTAAGYDPNEMAQTFAYMWRQQRYTTGEQPQYLLTHPTSQARLEALENLVRRHPPRAKPYDNTRFLVVRARLIALYEAEDRALSTFENSLTENPSDPYALYGMSLVEMRRSRFKEALSYLDRLDSQWKDKPVLMRAKGECNLLLGRYDQAVNLLERTLALKPDNQLAMLYLGQALLQKDDLQRASVVLGRLVEDHPGDAQAQYDLGVALGKMGNTAEASLHLGLSFKLRGNQRTALYHLKRAEKELAGRPELSKQAKKAIEEIEEYQKKHRPRPGPE